VGPAGSTATYVYDAAGQRVRKTSSAGTVDYIYDLAGHEIAEVSSAGALNRGEVYAGGRHLATYKNGTTYFNHVDWLGTERARSSLAAMLCEQIVSLPFGDGQSTNGSCGDPSPMHFTGKERDAETGLDNFGARYNASNMGRFMTPDPKMVSTLRMLDPQQWNRYAYVRNNPMIAVDPDGKELHLIVVDHSGMTQVQLQAVVNGIAQHFRDAGVQNVSVTSAPSVPFLARHDIGVDAHTVYVDFEKNHNGDAHINTDADGTNQVGWGWREFLTDHNSLGGPGGSAAGVETTSPGGQGIDGLIAVATHEIAHKWLEGVGGPNGDGQDYPDDIMNHGPSSLNNVPFSSSEAKKLKAKLNTSEEQKQQSPQRCSPTCLNGYCYKSCD